MFRCLAVAAVAAGCGNEASATLPPTPVKLAVTMEEFAFEHRQEVPAGRVVIEAANTGQLEHELQLIPLPEDLPPIPEQLRSEERRAVPTTAILDSREPGGTGVLAVDLAPGRYGLVCFVLDGDGVAHALKGMSSEFRVL